MAVSIPKFHEVLPLEKSLMSTFDFLTLFDLP